MRFGQFSFWLAKRRSPHARCIAPLAPTQAPVRVALAEPVADGVVLPLRPPLGRTYGDLPAHGDGAAVALPLGAPVVERRTDRRPQRRALDAADGLAGPVVCAEFPAVDPTVAVAERIPKPSAFDKIELRLDSI